MCSLLLALVKDNTAFVSPEDFQGILRRDAIYNAIGLVSFELFDQVSICKLLALMIIFPSLLYVEGHN
jgi:hypothetical protein